MLGVIHIQFEGSESELEQILKETFKGKSEKINYVSLLPYEGTFDDFIANNLAFRDVIKGVPHVRVFGNVPKQDP